MKIIHISDPHFGTEQNDIVETLSEYIHKAEPDMIIATGDFTQIGSVKEFKAAHNFLNTFNCPFLAIPGNHDVPARNLLRRFYNPYIRYKKYISKELEPKIKHQSIAFAGINSARRALIHWNWANGSVSKKQRHALQEFFNGHDGWRICFMHHPIHKTMDSDMPIPVTVFGRKRTLKCFEDLKIDLVLTGHVHHASITTMGPATHKTIFVSASTALSSRTRSQFNGFNIIEIDKNKIDIQIIVFDQKSFKKSEAFTHYKT